MARYDFTARRLFVDAALREGAEAALDREQANYLVNVLRLEPGASLLVFNGRDGEWRARLSVAGKRNTGLRIETRARAQTPSPDLHLLFAPLKHARLDYMTQKAVEMGVSRLAPVLTRRTQTQRVNGERMRANAIEAAEQCGVLNVPEIAEATPLERALAGWPRARRLIFCDEDAPVADPLAALAAAAGRRVAPLAVLIGPEGGFDPQERERLLAIEDVISVSLGPRILRADTAAVAALALVQAVLGDWRDAEAAVL